jgi:hypothetical protein
VTHDACGLGVILGLEDDAVLVDFSPQQRRIPLPCAKLTKLGKLAERLGQDMDQAFTLLRATPGTATCACPTWPRPSSTAPPADFPGFTAPGSPRPD